MSDLIRRARADCFKRHVSTGKCLVCELTDRVEELEALCQFHIAESKKVDEVVLKENARLKASCLRGDELIAEEIEVKDRRIAELENEIQAAIPHNQQRRYEMNRLQDEHERLRAVLSECLEWMDDAAAPVPLLKKALAAVSLPVNL